MVVLYVWVCMCRFVYVELQVGIQGVEKDVFLSNLETLLL